MFSSRERNCCKTIPRPCWMDDSEYLKDSRYETTEFWICAKKGNNSQVSWSERLAFSQKVGFLNSTCHFLKFMIIFRKLTLKMLAKSNKRTMGCVVIMNTDLFGQNFLCQKLDPPPKKNNEKPPFFNKCCKRCQKQIKNLWTPIEQRRNWQAWEWEEKLCKHVYSCPKANSSLWNRCLH